MKRAVMRPRLLRPPDLVRPSVKPLTGLPLYSPERSVMTSWRRLGVTGLKCLNAICLSSRQSEPGRDVDGLAVGQRHDRLLHVALTADRAAEALDLALADQGVDRRDLDAEQRLDRSLDFRLRRLAGDIEHDLVGFRSHGRLFGDHRGDDHVVVAKIRHLKRSSRASTAAFERTSVPRRRMS